MRKLALIEAALYSFFTISLEKTIHDEESKNDSAQPMQELKVDQTSYAANTANTRSQAKLEAQYIARQQAHTGEIQDLKQQLELKGNEIRSLMSTNDGLKSVNEELKVGIPDELYCHAFRD